MKRIFLLLSFVFILFTIEIYAEEGELFIEKPLAESSENGYVEYGIFDVEGNLVKESKREKSAELFSEHLPSKYDSRDYGYITSVKNQGSLGTCWAHAIVACAEANMIKKGYEKNFVNYSELHTAYFCHRRNVKEGDGLDEFDSKYGYFSGGNAFIYAQYATNFQGMAVESDFKYENATNSADFYLSEEDRYASNVRLNHYGRLETVEDAKKAIMEYGAITGSIYHDNKYILPNGAYYQNSFTNTNHEITIVGWDDNYSKFNYAEGLMPENDGAWIVKNSHGLTSGNFGYLMVSYEDTSLLVEGFFDFEPIGDENKVHSHNGSYVSGVLWQLPAANVFYVDENQKLTSVGFETRTIGSSIPEQYQVKIYVFTSKPSSPESGALRAVLSGKVSYDGFFKVDLDTPISLRKGQYFSVVLRLKDTEDQYAAITFEAGDKYSSESQESFFYNGSGWSDAHNYNISGYVIKNAAIKAYAETQSVNVTFNTHGHGKPESQKISKGGKITKPQDPYYEGYEFLGWYTDYTCVHEWNFSDPVEHDMVLYGKWSEPEKVSLNTRSKFFSWCYYPSYMVSAEHAENYILYFMKDGKIIGRSTLCDASNFKKWYNYGSRSDGKYECFAEIFGANGEYITTERIPYEVTHDIKLSVNAGYITVVNMPQEGVDLYIAQYSDNGRLLSLSKTKCNMDLSTDVKLFNCPENLENPKFFLWSRDGIIPLCESENIK